jgi:capsular polysaccharide biosynthesis protein
MVRLPAPARPLFPYLKPAYVAATRFVAPVSERMSRAGAKLLPTGAVDTLAQAAATSGGQWFTARAAERIERDAPRGIPADMPPTDTGMGDPNDVPELRVAILPGGRVLGSQRAVITGTGDLVMEVSRYWGTKRPREQPLFLKPSPPQPLRVPGRLGVIAGRGDSNYYHFLVDVLPRFGVLEQCPAVPPPERWYLPLSLPFQREFIDLLGIPAEQCVDAAEHPHVRADELVVPSLITEKNPPWMISWLRAKLLPDGPPTGPRTRIVLTRGPSANNRSLRNEAETHELLSGYGFVAVDPGRLSVTEQIATFAQAELIVAPHGAGLTNLVFASPGARVIELFPAGYLLPDYWWLASVVPGLDYRYLSAPRGRQFGLHNRGSMLVADIDVNLDNLRTLVEEWIS